MAVYPQSITDQPTIYESAGYPEYPNGGYHGGIDTVHTNHLAYAPAGGTIVVAHVWQGTTDDADSWGNYIVVDMGNGNFWLAAHFKSQIHSVGEVLKKGDYIGEQGETGDVTGIHTHWEYWVGGQSSAYRTDPSSLLGIPNGAPATYDVSWDATDPPGPGPGPGPGPTPSGSLPVWLLFQFNKGVFMY